MVRRREVVSARAALLWGVLCFAGIQVLFNVAMERWRPALRDPEFGFKLAFLEARRAEAPGQPVALVLGSSRAGLGVRPDILRMRQVVLFNFSQTGAGPVWELVTLRRLLEQGVRPDAMVVEVLPVWLHQEGEWTEEAQIHVNRLSWSDLAVLRRYSTDPDGLLTGWLWSRLVPCFSHRYSIVSWFAPDWLPDASRQDGWTAMDRWGWLAYSRPSSPEAYQAAVAQARREYGERLANYRLTEVPDRALRELLELCRQERIPVTVLVMPEGTEFQSWYGSEAQREIDAYLARVCAEYNVPLVNARGWMQDTAFFDSHHLHPEESTAFTRRLGREVLPPLLLRARKQTAKSN